MSSTVGIGLDVGGTKSQAVLVNMAGEVLAEQRTPSPHDTSEGAGTALAGVLAKQIADLCDENGLDPVTVPIGIGLPGLVRRSGKLAFAPNLQSANGVDLPTLLREAIGATNVHVENDANAAALAEHEWGAGRGIDDFVMVTLGTGIGGGVIANGELVRGGSGFGGEIGHLIVLADGVLCPCGVRGCWERYASGGGLQRMTREAAEAGRLPTLVERKGSIDAVRAEDVTAAGDENLGEAVALLREVGRWLAVGLGSLAVILGTNDFVIGGGLSSASGHILPSAREHLREFTMGYEWRPPFNVQLASLGEHAGALGAALVGMQRSA